LKRAAMNRFRACHNVIACRYALAVEVRDSRRADTAARKSVRFRED
jgi:hypothetical protein